MITYEEYNKNRDNGDDTDMKLPVTAIVIIIVLLSLVGVFIVCQAIYGL